MTPHDLFARLNLPAPPALPDPAPRDADMPWYLWAMSGLGAFVSGLFLMFLAGLVVLATGLSQDMIALGLGALFMAAGLALNRANRAAGPLFLLTLALTLVIGGAMLTVGGVLGLTRGAGLAAVVAWGLTAALVPALRSAVVGFIGTAGAMGLTVAAILVAGSPDAPLALLTIVAVAAGSAVLVAPPSRLPDLRPAALVVLVAPLPVLQFADILAPLSLIGAAPYLVVTLGLVWREIGGRVFLLAVPLVGLAVLSPGAAGACLLLALAYALGNRIFAAVGVVGLVASVVHLYYVLDMTLLAKAGVLAVCGLLTLAAWSRLRGPATRRASTPAALPRRVVAGVVAGLLLVTGFVGWRVAANEALLANGTELHVALAPLDPRSLIQGDYMALAFDDRLLPPDHAAATLPRRGVLVVARDPQTLEARGLRLHDGTTPPAAGELLLAYRLRNGRVVVGADSFLFQEGTAEDHAEATHGVLRVAPDGAALLVGLR